MTLQCCACHGTRPGTCDCACHDHDNCKQELERLHVAFDGIVTLHDVNLRELEQAKAWRKCTTHGDINGAAQWGCPDCVAQLRRELTEAHKTGNALAVLVDKLHAELAAANEHEISLEADVEKGDETETRLRGQLEQAKAQQVHCAACGGVECHRLAEIVKLAGMESDQHLVEWVEQAKERYERAEVQLAGCGAAALGWAGDPLPIKGDWGWSGSLQDVLELRAKWDEAKERFRGFMPEEIKRYCTMLESQLSEAKERLIETTGKAAEHDAALEALSGTDERLPLFGRIMQLRTEAKELERQLQIDLSQPNPNVFVPSTTTDGTGNSEAFRELSSIRRVRELEAANTRLTDELSEARKHVDWLQNKNARLRDALTKLDDVVAQENMVHGAEMRLHHIIRAALTVPPAEEERGFRDYE